MNDEYSNLLETIIELNSQPVTIMDPERSCQKGTNPDLADACGAFISQILKQYKNESTQYDTMLEAT